MKKLWKKLIGDGFEESMKKIKLKNICLQHRDNMYLIANERCEQCETSQCYVCVNNSHMLNCDGMNLKIEKNIIILITQQNCNKNLYYLMLDMQQRLIQKKFLVYAVDQKGKSFLDKDYSFICAACGNASCSSDCHLNHYTNQNLCTFQENFAKDSGAHALPSIVSRNIKLAQQNKLPVGKILNKTSFFFMMAYNHPKENWVYLQRGYRQYGNPIKDNFIKFNVFEKKNLDFFKLKKRTCLCDCSVCAHRYEHSVLSCSQLCDSKDQQLKIGMDEIFDFQRLDQVCHCSCEFCQSAIVNLTHTLKDCFVQCPHNELKNELNNI